AVPIGKNLLINGEDRQAADEFFKRKVPQKYVVFRDESNMDTWRGIQDKVRDFAEGKWAAQKKNSINFIVIHFELGKLGSFNEKRVHYMMVALGIRLKSFLDFFHEQRISTNQHDPDALSSDREANKNPSQKGAKEEIQ